MNKRSLFTLFLVVAAEMIGFGLIVPVLPQIAERFSVNEVALGFLLGSYSLAQFFGAPILGKLSDRYGRKPVLMVSQFGNVISLILLAFSGNYAMMLANRLLNGFTGGNIAAARAYISDTTTPAERPRGMAIIGIAFGVGFVIGPAIGGLLYSATGNGWMIPSLISAALSFIAFICTGFFLKESRIVDRSKAEVMSFHGLGRALKHPLILRILLLQMAFMAVSAGFETTFAIFTNRTFGFDPSQNSWLYMFIGVIAFAVLGGIMTFHTKRLRRTTLIGIILYAFGLAAVAIAPSVPLMLAAIVLLAFGQGIVVTYLPSFLSSEGDAKSSGELMGLFEGVGGLARIVGPIVIALTVQAHPRTTYVWFAIAYLVISFPLMMAGRKKKQLA